MKSITFKNSGLAVEDIQERLSALGYVIDETERATQEFGNTTAIAIGRFRLEHGLEYDTVLDPETWALLVDEGYELGDRNLYLRLPNFRGKDVRQLQERLNILGFSCGKIDGKFGVHTEAALKLFQESSGALPDGMAFPDTFAAIERLRHVWSGKPAEGPHPQGGMSFARAAHVLEETSIAITADDQISRNVAARISNLAHATSAESGLNLLDAQEDPTAYEMHIMLSTTAAPHDEQSGVGNLLLDDLESFPIRLRTALQSSAIQPHAVRVILPVTDEFDHPFTVSDAQTFAVLILDAICTACDPKLQTSK